MNTKINKITDPDNITPVNRFDLANYGIYLTLATFYGGKTTIGDEAKVDMVKKIIEEKIELEDDDFDLDIDLEDFTEEEPVGEEEVEKILDEQMKPIKQREEEELDLDDIDFDI